MKIEFGVDIGELAFDQQRAGLGAKDRALVEEAWRG